VVPVALHLWDARSASLLAEPARGAVTATSVQLEPRDLRGLAARCALQHPGRRNAELPAVH